MIKALIANGIGFNCGIKYVVTRGMDIGAAVEFWPNRQLVLDGQFNPCTAIGLPMVPMWNTAGRPVVPKRGQFGFNTTTKLLEVYDGSDWN